MKYFICSDIHGDYECAKLATDTFVKEGADKLIILGDILYHGPRNDLPPSYAPKKVIPLLNSFKDKIIAVRGNCDAEVDAMVLDFKISDTYLRLEEDGLKIFATHGHIYNSDTEGVYQDGEILLHGHTHIPKCMSFGRNNTYINPGSVTLPKENNPKTYILYSDRTFTAKDFEGNVIFTKKF